MQDIFTWGAVLPIVTILTVLIMLWQNIRAKKAEEYKFLLDAEMHFSNNEDIQRLHKKLISIEKGLMEKSEITDDDIADISAYLTFFESFFPLIKNRLYSYRKIDSRFGYRFFIAMHNADVQKKEFFKDFEHYQNLYKQYIGWRNYRERKNIKIPLDENRFEVKKETGVDRYKFEYTGKQLLISEGTIRESKN